MGCNWTDFLRGPAPGDHGVQIYDDLEELADSVTAYLVAGFESGDPALVFATHRHLSSFAERLASAGWEPRTLEAEGLLALADADSMLGSIMRGGRPSAIAFEAVVGTLIDQAAERFPGHTPRAFGEMVNVLCERGQPEAAVELEELWNALARERRFSLLCGYRLSVFDRNAQAGTLPDVCRLHSHVLPAPDDARLARAVDRALDEVLGHAEAGQIYMVIRDQIREERVPVPQLLLMWVSANMPVLADRILAAARSHYYADAHAA
jgi:hypothetical protein